MDGPCDDGLEHIDSLNSVGYGFGNLEYYCQRCQKLLRSVPLAEMNAAEKKHVAWLVNEVVAE